MDNQSKVCGPCNSTEAMSKLSESRLGGVGIQCNAAGPPLTVLAGIDGLQLKTPVECTLDEYF